MIKHQGSVNFQIKEIEYHTVTITIDGDKEVAPGETTEIIVNARCPNECSLEGMSIVIEAEDGSQTGEYPLIMGGGLAYYADNISVPAGNWTAILIGG